MFLAANIQKGGGGGGRRGGGGYVDESVKVFFSKTKQKKLVFRRFLSNLV